MSDASPPLPHRHLLTLSLKVDGPNALQIGPTPAGHRSIAPVLGGTFTGERLQGEVLPGGADWAVVTADGMILIDVRLTLKTDDGALIYLSYEGRFMGERDALKDLAKGKVLNPATYSLATVAKFETGNLNYAWLNNVVAVGVGVQSGFSPVYTIYEIG